MLLLYAFLSSLKQNLYIYFTLFYLKFINCEGVWYDGPTSRDLVSPERRRNPEEESMIGTGQLRYPYSPDRPPSPGTPYTFFMQ